MARWIITDIDGCISPEESVAWEMDEFLTLARRIQDANTGRSTLAPVTFCTGRPQPYVEVLMKLLGVHAPAICENGAVFYTLHNNTARYAPGVTKEKISGLRALRRYIESEILPAYQQTVIQFGKEAQLSIFSEETACFDEIKPRLEQFVAQNGGLALDIVPSHFYLNISLAGVDKGEALRLLLSQLGIRREDAAGIGDTDGDLPLRDAVGFFACPANAKDSLKAVADYVSPYPLVGGMLDILSRPEFQKGLA